MRTLHVKALNRGSATSKAWTDRLAQLVERGGAEALGDVRIDGPYGSAGDLTASTDLVLVAGGIGITPIHAVFAELLALASAPEAGGLMGTPLRRVRLVWASRTLGELGLFAETLHAAALREGRLQQQEGSPRQQEGSAPQQQQTVRFESHLYVTGNADDGELSSLPDAVAAWLRASVKEGRPDLPGVCHNLTREKGDSERGKTSAFFVCGPAALARIASEQAYACDAHFHSEVFHF